MTDLSRRKEAEELARRADEDGPPASSDSSGAEDNATNNQEKNGKDELTDDEGDSDDTPVSQGRGATVLPLERQKQQAKVPNPRWDRSKSPESP